MCHRYRALAAFAGTEGQHQCVPGDVFLVLEKDADGWWLALKLGIENDGKVFVCLFVCLLIVCLQIS